MRYLPQTDAEIKKMCEAVGVERPHDLFHVIPEHLQLSRALDLPAPLGEPDLLAHLKSLGRDNENVDSRCSFLGGGAYHHYIPVGVSSITSRGEFFTSYTPYQPEISQGTLQAIFEFQTMVASLTGMDLANASNYDGASALAEALLMALRLTRRRKILVAASLNPQYVRVVRTYLANMDCEIHVVPMAPTGRIDREALHSMLDEHTAALALQSPNAFGVVEDMRSLSQRVQESGALCIATFTEALSLAMFQSPGAQGADIVAGEGQSLGNFLSLGGPYLGLFATREKFVRQMPGRLVGETVDSDGKRGFVLVLSTREQHIRREKATSNICTNQALCALGTAVYLSLLGPQGLTRLAQTNYSVARYLRQSLCSLPGVQSRFSAPHFNEFVLRLPRSSEEVLNELRQEGIWGGIDVSTWGDDLENCILVCATEMNTREQIDRYKKQLERIL